MTRPARYADLRGQGVARREVDGALWRRTWRGVREWSGLEADDPVVRLRSAALLLPPSGALGGWGALHLRGVPDVDGRLGLTGTTRPVLLCVGPVELIESRPGLLVDRGRDFDRGVDCVSGVRVVSSALAVCQIARRDGTEEGLVAADAALRAGVLTAPDLRAQVSRMARRPGVLRMRTVAEMVTVAAASPPESRLRYIWVVEAALPVPLVNQPVVDLRDGHLVGVADLFDPATGLVGEYDGAYHRAVEQHTADNVREESLERLNCTVVRATSLDVWGGRDRLVARLRAGHRDARARDVRRDRWALRRP